ncbi:hypothetical protein ACFYW8_24800 [Streptomyces sp. NPDC002742]|uniref:hypothetical protein n=1 Tax=Streptomyces sp. NPDC002742 TaxID=3364663 RepID=UPI0036C4BDE9
MGAFFEAAVAEDDEFVEDPGSAGVEADLILVAVHAAAECAAQALTSFLVGRVTSKTLSWTRAPWAAVDHAQALAFGAQAGTRFGDVEGRLQRGGTLLSTWAGAGGSGLAEEVHALVEALDA